ncbi:DHH family phosphoesterase [Anaerobaca lacustris]|uniref:Bifunctional oligoribonuclease/PAP phosphatase NrnA n=1 Tax=Anaerobaca lacustris TaxID=3044600 RepID=A0AAW6TPD8_9BACT|nr:bifunctional oligoribonuclease/PAP phosphatase NrnA [Sedimentisphaerales bacterium M17dextr]
MTDMHQQALTLIENASDILITTHTRPDGDACGCVAALTEALRGLGKTVRPLFLSPVPSWYAFLFDEPVPVLRTDVQVEELAQSPFGRCDLILIVDTNSYSQLPHFEEHLKRIDTPILVIDHHVTSDGLGTVEIVDPTAAAAGLVVYDFFRAAGLPITAKMAEALFVAIATDTGWFQFNNTTSRVYRCAADLIDLGISPTDLYDRLHHTYSQARFRLLVTMLDRLELHLDGRYAVQYLLQEDFVQTGAVYEDTENFINECHRIASVVVSTLLVELKDGRIRCSLRSRGAVDVSEIAARFGGGGHKMAAGTFLPGPIDHARQLIFHEVTQRLP